MIKVFISQPMRGLSEEKILRDRDEAIRYVKTLAEQLGQDIEVIDSYFEDYNPEQGCIPMKYLSKSIELLADADLALFIGDYDNARGCKIEHDCAKAYDIKTAYYKGRTE